LVKIIKNVITVERNKKKVNIPRETVKDFVTEKRANGKIYSEAN
jgi:hypothetical protein